MTRTPTPSVSAEESDSTSPSNTLTSVSRARATYASTCSPSVAWAATRSAMARSSAIASGRGPADGDGTHPQGRLTGRHGHALAVLAARPGPRVEVVADGVDQLQHLGAIPDEVGRADRVGDLAVLDHVGLGYAKHEVTGGRVDLSPTELHAVHAVRRLADDLVGVFLALEHVGVRHADHRQVLIALPAPVAR